MQNEHSRYVLRLSSLKNDKNTNLTLMQYYYFVNVDFLLSPIRKDGYLKK